MDVVEVVGETVVVGASVLGVSFTAVGADSVVADFSTVGATLISVCNVWGVCTGAALTAGVVADVVTVFTGDIGLIGLVGFVGLVTDFLQVFDVVTQGCHTGLPYGSGHVEERVWVMLPV